MNKALKITLISIGGLFGLFMVISIIGAIAGAGQPAQPVAIKTIDTGPSPEPIITPTNKPTPTQAPKKVETPKPVKKVTPKPKAKVTRKPVDREEVFLAVMRKEYPQLKDTKDSVILTVGHGVCSEYRSGWSFIHIASEMMDNGFTAEQAGYTIGASTAAFCPKYNVS